VARREALIVHWRTFLDSEVIRYVDLQGQDFTLQIKQVKRGKVTGKNAKSTGKAMIYFEGREKPLGAGAETLDQIARLYSTDTRKWPGKWITIWPDPTVKYGGEAVGGVRVRPVVPKVDEAKDKQVKADGPSGQKEGAA
jgi:hypothetical protein